MFVGSVRLVGAGRLEEVLCVVRDEVEAHEDEEDGHGEANYYFGAFEAGCS